MSTFTEKEIEYLRAQRLGRLATVDAKGRPHVVPVAFRYNPQRETIDIGGHNLARSKKFRDAAESGLAAFVVDDVVPGDRWRARGVEVRGRAEVFSDFADELIRVVPERIVGWGIDSDAYRPNARSVG
ncbi:MAG: PPOX class F420-dependent oxidoreductase [Actinomycetota bacterium]|nr:PPOX class F420-dependent oxidoreductase [Actinomycetota bacterium]MDP9487966.1 PPOX class F420-dependent oxidoreductase [Actinomycetota bacterium]